MTHWVGTSGWSYDHWHGVLYPEGLSPGERFDHNSGWHGCAPD